jgi:hypothetical protein
MKLYRKDYGEYFVILLLTALGIYLQFFPLTKTENDLKKQRIFLREKLVLKERGEERQKYIRILDARSSSKFDLTGCALLRANTDILLSLNRYDSLTLGIRKSETFTEMFNREIDVVYISSSHGPLLTLDDYNDCQEKSGKITPFLILGVILILLFRIVDRHREGKVS